MGASMSAVAWPVSSFDNDLRAIGEIDRLSRWRARRQNLVLSSIGVHGEERDLLEVGAVVACGLEAGERELRGDVFGGKLGAARAGAAAFEQIEREEAHVGANLLGIDGSGCGAGCGRQACDGGNRFCVCGR